MADPPGATGPVGTPSSSPTPDAGAGGATLPPGSTPTGIGGSGAHLPPPRRVSPRSATPPGGPGANFDESASLPADLMASWRGLMTSIGATVPYHLNHTVRITRLMRRGSR